jgi:hypothetical protein
MLANAVDRGGHAASLQRATHLDKGISALDSRPPGSAGNSRLEATAWFVEKKTSMLTDFFSPLLDKLKKGPMKDATKGTGLAQER